MDEIIIDCSAPTKDAEGNLLPIGVLQPMDPAAQAAVQAQQIALRTRLAAADTQRQADLATVKAQAAKDPNFAALARLLGVG